VSKYVEIATSFGESIRIASYTFALGFEYFDTISNSSEKSEIEKSYCAFLLSVSR